MIKGAIFDFNRTIYDPESDALIEGSLDLLEKLISEGYKLCLLSKKTTKDRRQQISNLGLDEYFLGIQVIEGKKSVENLERCRQVMSLKASEIAVVGDRVQGEISLGNQLGMVTIWYKSGKFSNEMPQNESQKPTHTITKLEETLQYLK